MGLECFVHISDMREIKLKVYTKADCRVFFQATDPTFFHRDLWWFLAGLLDQAIDRTLGDYTLDIDDSVLQDMRNLYDNLLLEARDQNLKEVGLEEMTQLLSQLLADECHFEMQGKSLVLVENQSNHIST